MFCAVLFAVFTLAVKPPELFIVNGSPSSPRGLYRVSARPPAPGDYVVVDPGHLPFTVTEIRILKRIAYAANEDYNINQYRLLVGNVYYWKYRNIGPEQSGRLDDDECLILGGHPKSFDSRYFGPVNLAYCTRVVPLLLIDERL